ncbi:MAG TPA: VanZ family protein [Pyrinomonadaceae bacterium]|jgi:VanZ family protein|nr:VanZ family protein [Pyrinomonadaceae bacterium]
MMAQSEGGEDTNATTLRRRVWRYGPLVLWMALIFFFSTAELSAGNTSRIVRPVLLWLFPGISEESLLRAHFLTRKAAHFTEYAILALLAARAFYGSSRKTLRRRWFTVALTLVILYALSDEYHQSFVPSRTGSVYDSMIDASGGLAALLFLALRRKRKNSRGEG